VLPGHCLGLRHREPEGERGFPGAFLRESRQNPAVKQSSQGRFKIRPVAFPWDAKPENKDKPAREGKAKWVAASFTSLQAESTVINNSRGAPTSYELIPTRFGSAEELLKIGDAQDVKADMDFINYDFWVTRTPKKNRHYHELPNLAEGGLPLKGHAATV
jgi:hypothetical protein